MRRSILSTLFLVVVAVAVVAQQTQDALYIYRNDGGFNAFFYADIDHIEYSCIDTTGVEHDEYVVQEIYALDSVFRIPISAIDSVGFVTPETKYKNDVKATTESDFWSYVIGSDTINMLKLRKDIPQRLIPAVGDKLVTTESRDYLPRGFFGKVLSINDSNDAITVVCEIPELTELFDKWVCKVAAATAEDNNEVKGNAPSQASTVYTVPLKPQELHYTLKDYHGNDGSIEIEGTAKLDLTLNQDLRVRAFLYIDCEQIRNREFHLDVTKVLVTRRSYAFNLHGKIEASRDFAILSASMPLGSTPLNLEVEAGVKLAAKAEGEFFSARNQMSQQYSMVQHNYSHYDPSSTYSYTTGTIHDVYSLSENKIKGTAEFSVGIYYSVGVSLFMKDMAWAGMRYDIGRRAELSLNMSVPSEYFEPLHEELPNSMVDSPTLLYDQLADGSVRFTPYCTGQVELAVGLMKQSYFCTDTEIKKYEWEGGMVPEFSGTEAFVRQDGKTVAAHTYLKRRLLFREPVGFAAYFLENNKLAGQAWKVHPYNGDPSQPDYAFAEMSLPFITSGPGNLLRVYPVLKIPEFGYELLCSPYTDVVIPPVIEIAEDTLHAEKGATQFQVEVETNCKDIGVCSITCDNALDWVEASLSDPTQDFDKRILTIDVAQNKEIFQRTAEIILYAAAGDLITYDTLYVKQKATPVTSAKVFLSVAPRMKLQIHQETYHVGNRYTDQEDVIWSSDREEYNNIIVFQTPTDTDEGVVAQCSQNGNLLTISGSFDISDNNRGINGSWTSNREDRTNTYTEHYDGSFTVVIDLSEYGGRLVNCKAQMRWETKATESIIRRSTALGNSGWYWYTQERENSEEEMKNHYSFSWKLNTLGSPYPGSLYFETDECSDGSTSAQEMRTRQGTCYGYSYTGSQEWSDVWKYVDSQSSSTATKGELRLSIVY